MFLFSKMNVAYILFVTLVSVLSSMDLWSSCHQCSYYLDECCQCREPQSLRTVTIQTGQDVTHTVNHTVLYTYDLSCSGELKMVCSSVSSTWNSSHNNFCMVFILWKMTGMHDCCIQEHVCVLNSWCTGVEVLPCVRLGLTDPQVELQRVCSASLADSTSMGTFTTG